VTAATDARCVVCGDALAPLRDDVRDWEYGVAWASRLVACPGCGLVTHDPPIAAHEIARLYPSDYLAHGGASASRSIYGRLKAVLGRLGARGVARHLPPGGAILEIGCGNGGFLRAVHARRPDVRCAGVDLVDVGVDGIPGFAFFHGQLEDVDLGGRTFDVVYCSNLIEHVPDPRRFLARAAAALAPGGVIYGVTPDHLSLDRYLMGRYWAGYHYPRHTFVFDHKNLRTLLERSGYEVLKLGGSYGFWYTSLANRFVARSASRPRGLGFAAVTAAFLPLDLLINLFRVHGSMTFVARRPG
jgi:SAM-dependent methyltransferase